MTDSRHGVKECQDIWVSDLAGCAAGSRFQCAKMWDAATIDPDSGNSLQANSRDSGTTL
jgi:hypothetical protein